MLIWLDTETTGLHDPKDGSLLEVGIIVTDDELTEVARASWLIDCQVGDPRNLAEPVALEMHQKSGLWEDWEAGPRHHHEVADRSIPDWLAENGVEAGTAPLCGSTIGFDRKWIGHWLPALAKYPHYRSIDVSTLKETMRRFAPAVFGSRPEKAKNHRVLDDCEESLREFRHYVEAIRG